MRVEWLFFAEPVELAGDIGRKLSSDGKRSLEAIEDDLEKE
jgi:hypothetical protein